MTTLKAQVIKIDVRQSTPIKGYTTCCYGQETRTRLRAETPVYRTGRHSSVQARTRYFVCNQRGIAFVIALIMLLVLTLIGVGSISMTTYENNIAGKAVAFKEALEPEFKEYARQIMKNAKALEEEFKKRDYKLCFGGTDNHLLLIDVTSKGLSGKEAQIALDKAGITVNKNMIPDDTRSPFDPSGIRLGTPALTTRGMKEEEMRIIAGWIDEVIMNWQDEQKLAAIKQQVIEMTKKFPLYKTL